jgi:hypothetical protein
MAPVDTSEVGMTADRVMLSGVSFTKPEGWVKEEPGTMSRKAQFRLAKADNEVEDCEVVITHFPTMKGEEMDRMNIQRWLGQFSRADGGDISEHARIARMESGAVKLTAVDVSGNMGASPMSGIPTAQENYRMIAAIVDHADGPHFVKLTGPIDGVERWKASMFAFLQSATANK